MEMKKVFEQPSIVLESLQAEENIMVTGNEWEMDYFVASQLV